MLNYIKDRLIRARLERDEKEIKIGFLVTGFALLALTLSIVYLSFRLANNSTVSSISSTPSRITASPTLSPTATPASTLVPKTPQPSSQNTTSTGKFKDYYINLGSGANQSADWKDVAGTLTTVDLGQYKNIREVRLETTINVPTANGTISVRLFNKTDNYAVWNSERTVQSEANDFFLISEKLIYDVGPKLYQVQMKSQLNVSANLLQARIHVIAQE